MALSYADLGVVHKARQAEMQKVEALPCLGSIDVRDRQSPMKLSISLPEQPVVIVSDKSTEREASATIRGVVYDRVGSKARRAYPVLDQATSPRLWLAVRFDRHSPT